MSSTMTITGDKEIEKKLLKLEKKTSKKVVRQAVRNTQKVTLNHAKATIKGEVGGELGSLLAKATVLRKWKKLPRGVYAMAVEVSDKYNDQLVYVAKHDSKYSDMKSYIPAAVEYGYVHWLSGEKIAGYHIFEKAHKATYSKRRSKIKAELWAGIKKLAGA